MTEKEIIRSEVEKMRGNFKLLAVASRSSEGTIENFARADACTRILSFIDTNFVKKVEEKEGLVQDDYQVEFEDGKIIDLDPTMQFTPVFNVKPGEKIKVIIIKEG